MFNTRNFPRGDLIQTVRPTRPSAENAPRQMVPRAGCMFWHICMALSLDDFDVVRLNNVVRNWRMVKQGQSLYRYGDSFQSIYEVRSGSFKTVLNHQSGREYVSGFFLPGETLGLDGISTEIHTCDAVALEDSAICAIPFHLLETLCREVKALQWQFHRMMGAEIVRETSQMMLLGNFTAEQRVVAFLLSMSTRLQRMGYSPTSFSTRMTREDIGSYLGMTLETVSRTLSRLQQEGVIRVQGKQVDLLDLEILDSR